MFEKLKSYLNENFFAVLMLGLAGTLGYFASQLTKDNLQITAVKVINAALLLGISAGFIKLLRGTKYDVIKEIFEQNNIAAAIFTVGFVNAISIAITVVS